MILIFDLDDTLYEEITYVKSGFLEVSKYANKKYGFNIDSSLNYMNNTLEMLGRGKVFDEFLKSKNLFTQKRLKKFISTYRNHKPKISIFEESKKILKKRSKQIYLVTDGNKIVQANKIKALCIEQFFKKIFITHRYGIHHSKPSLYCFELIKKKEKCDWKDLIYIGDNPEKDFINLNIKGATTIRVLTGAHSKKKAKKGYDAKYKIKNISDLEPLINKLITKKE